MISCFNRSIAIVCQLKNFFEKASSNTASCETVLKAKDEHLRKNQISKSANCLPINCPKSLAAVRMTLSVSCKVFNFLSFKFKRHLSSNKLRLKPLLNHFKAAGYRCISRCRWALFGEVTKSLECIKISSNDETE